MAVLRDTKHVEWARAFIALLEELRVYVMEFHTTGLVWNAKVTLPQHSFVSDS